MAACVTNIILLFAVIGEVAGSCVDTGEDNVVPVCTDCSKTAKVVQIDTSMVPRRRNLICTCHISSSGMPTWVTIAYDGPNYRPCGIAFEIMFYTFSCKTDVSIKAGSPSDILFRKGYTGLSSPATLSISEEHENSTVTVLCLKTPEEFSTTSVPLSAATHRLFSQTRQSTLQSMPAESSSMVTATNTIAAIETTLTMPNTPVNEITLSQSQQLGSSEDNQTVIVAATVGVCGVLFLVLTAVLLAFCYRKRRQTSKPGRSTDHVYVNTDCQTSDKVNVIELYDAKPEVRDNEAAATYDTVDSDGKCKLVNVATPVLYNNLRTDDDDAPYNMLNLDRDHCAEHLYTSLDIKQPSDR